MSGVYGSQRVLGGVPRNPHYGVDIAVPSGTPIVAPADGVVALASPPQFSLEGNLVIIDHGMGVNTAYLHLSRVDVRRGERVRRGQRIGRSEEHTSELQSLMRISYAVFCLKKKHKQYIHNI